MTPAEKFYLTRLLDERMAALQRRWAELLAEKAKLMSGHS
jgi:hypothetical protein